MYWKLKLALMHVDRRSQAGAFEEFGNMEVVAAMGEEWEVVVAAMGEE